MHALIDAESPALAHPGLRPANVGERDKHFLVALALYIVSLHGLMLLYDAHNGFSPFLDIDRSGQRLDAMRGILAASGMQSFFTAITGHPIILGEYLPQAGLFSLGGTEAVVIFQVLLHICSVLITYRIARLAGLSPQSGFFASLLYASLPQGLAYAHQLASESIAVPILVTGYWLFLAYRANAKPHGFLLASGFLFGLVSCIRPAMLLLPFFLGIFLAGKGIRHIAAFLAMSVLTPLMLSACFLLATHHISLGNANSGLNYNLYLRAMRVTHAIAAEEQSSIAERYFHGAMDEACAQGPQRGHASPCSLPPAVYADFVLHYPGANARYFFKDIASFLGKSGASALTIGYFNIEPRNAFAIKDYANGWHAQWESGGLAAAIRSVFARSPVTAIIELLGCALFLMLSTCALAGAAEAVHRYAGDRSAVTPVILAGHIAYVFLTSSVAAYVSSRYRYPAEFAFCILAALGAAKLRDGPGKRAFLA